MTLNNIPLKNDLRRYYLSSRAVRNISVDIIMATYNRAGIISEAIDSITRQLHSSWFLYICDDGSTDSTRDICKMHLKDPRINYIYQSHRGVSSARNLGLKASNSEYIAFLDTDNKWSCEYLSLMISFLRLNLLDAAFCAAVIEEDGNPQLTWLGNYFDWRQCLTSNYIDLNCFAVKRLSLNNTRIDFDEKLERFVDWDLILRCTANARVSFLDCALVNYYNGNLHKRITTNQCIGEEQRLTKQIRDKHGEEGKNIDAIMRRPHSFFNT